MEKNGGEVERLGKPLLQVVIVGGDGSPVDSFGCTLVQPKLVHRRLI